MIIIKEKRKSTPIYIMRNDVENVTGGDNETYITEAELNSKLSDYPTIDEVGAQLSTKQDNLISGDNIKTINGESVLGSGNLEITADVDLSDYYTKGEMNNKLGDYATIVVMNNVDNSLRADINSVNDKVDNIVVPTLTSQLTNDSGYITESDVNTKLSDYPTRGEVVFGYYNKSEVDNLIDNTEQDITEKIEMDITSTLNTYATKIDVAMADNELQQQIDNIAIPKYTSDLINDNGYINIDDLKGYATESWVNSQIATEIGTINNALENLIG